VCARGPHVVALPGSSKASRTQENLGAADVVLSAQEVAELDEIVAKAEIRGGRYNDKMAGKMHLWG
jgi:pyridoxine 4-dehydrogenase